MTRETSPATHLIRLGFTSGRRADRLLADAAIAGHVSAAAAAGAPLDEGIVRALWLSPVIPGVAPIPCTISEKSASSQAPASSIATLPPPCSSAGVPSSFSRRRARNSGLGRHWHSTSRTGSGMSM